MKKDFGANPFLYPMPVLIVAAYDEEGNANAMNAAWGGICADDGISMCLSPGHKTVKNILKKGAFTVSIGDVDNMVACDYVGIASGNNVKDKMAKAGFTTVKSDVVDAPIIEQLKMVLECELSSYDEESHLMIGKIKNVKADESILDENGNIAPEKLQAISYDPVNHKYLVIGEAVGNAFEDGKQLG